MMNRAWIPVVFVSLLGISFALCGCSSEKSLPENNKPGKELPKVTGNNGDVNSNNSENQGQPPKLVPSPVDPRAWPFEVPGDDNVPVQVKQTLGEQVDTALANLEMAYGDGLMQYDNGGKKLKGQVKAMVEDQTKFNVAYCLPETEQHQNRIIADGSRRVNWQAGDITELPPLGERKTTTKPMSRKEIEEWAERFPLVAFDEFAGGDTTWQSLISGLNDPNSGFEVTSNEKSTKVNDKDRKLIMITAKSTGERKMDIQLKIDGVRYLPLTVKVDKVREDGTKLKMYWNMRWAFTTSGDDVHDQRFFQIPKPRESSEESSS